MSKSDELIQEIEFMLKEKFEMSNLGDIQQFLGMEITKDDDGNFLLGNSNYIDKIISELGLTDAKIAKTPMDPSYGKL